MRKKLVVSFLVLCVLLSGCGNGLVLNEGLEERQGTENTLQVVALPESDPLAGKLEVAQSSLWESGECEGEIPLLVILLEFDDVSLVRTEEQWEVAIFGEQGVSGYFDEVSGGKLRYEPMISKSIDGGAVKVHLPVDMPIYRENDAGLDSATHVGTDGRQYRIPNSSFLFAYAVNAVDEQCEDVDFSRYDRDGDGFLASDELSFLVISSGYDATSLDEPEGEQAVWAHQWNINEYAYSRPRKSEGPGYEVVRLDGVGISDYLMVGELTAPEVTQIGHICHELAHTLGAEDVYDVTYALDRVGTDALSLMDSGNWAFSDDSPIEGSVPTHPDPLNKQAMGFVKAEKVRESGTYPLYASSDPRYNVLEITTADPDICYLVENRQFSGFDRGLKTAYLERPGAPATTHGGIVVWRVNRRIVDRGWDDNEINAQEEDWGLTCIFADGALAEYPRRPFWSSEALELGDFAIHDFGEIKMEDSWLVIQEKGGRIALNMDVEPGQVMNLEIDCEGTRFTLSIPLRRFGMGN